jgi:predicted transcriptional regulator of viral defense system
MNFQDFREAFFNQISFTSNQVQAWYPGFDKNNLGRWVKKGYLIKLRNGHYTFKEYLNAQNIQLYLANRIYRPSYISLHTALAFYGLIPESVTQTTSISTLKTAKFNNPVGQFSYKNIKEQLFFGYEQLPFLDKRSIQIATPEKSLIDLLYLYPFYNNKNELQELRLDEDILDETFNTERFLSYLDQTKNTALAKRAKLLLKVYNIH